MNLERTRNNFKDQGKTESLNAAHRSKIHSLAWSCDGKRLASGSTDMTIGVWPVEKLLQLATSASTSSISSSYYLKGHTGSVDQLAWSPTDPKLLASVSSDKTLRLWDTDSMSLIGNITLQSECINVAWNSQGTKLVVGGKDDVVTVVDVTTQSIEGSRAFREEVNEITWSPHGDKIIITRGTGTVDILTYPALETEKSLPGHTSNCYCIDFNSNGEYFAVGSADAIVSLWSYRDLVCLRTFCRLEWPIRSVSFNGDGTMIAAASEDTFIDISHVESGELVHKVPTTTACNTIAWHPKQMMLVFAGDDVDPRTGRSIGNIHIFRVK